MTLGQQVDKLIQAYEYDISDTNRDTSSPNPYVREKAKKSVVTQSESLRQFKAAIRRAIDKYDF